MNQSVRKEIAQKSGSELSVVDLDINSAKIAALALRFSELPKDLSKDENYRSVQDAINEAREMSGKIVSKGKSLKEDALKWQKKVVAEEKRLKSEIVVFLDPTAARKKAYDDEVKAEKERKRIAEQLRKDAHLANINSIRILTAEAQGKKSEEVDLVIKKLEAIKIDDDYEEFQDEAQDVWIDTELALQKILINAQTVEEADRKRAVEDERLKLERKALADEKAENERIRLANEEVSRQNKADAQALEDAEKAKEVAKAAQEEKQAEEIQEPCETEKAVASSAGISESVQNKIDDDNSVVAQCRKNAIAGILAVIEENEALSKTAIASNILDAIISHKIPNVRYDIY